MALEDWSRELQFLRERGVELADGLTGVEVQRVERLYGFRFPPDLRSLLSIALPSGDEFPNWRQADSAAVRKSLAWPFEGIAFDIEHDDFWWDAWGPRPASLAAAIEVARTALQKAPTLIPIYSHRYLPAEPELPGNPVFAVYQTDIVYYGSDLRKYMEHEFGGGSYSDAVHGNPRRIPFWSEIVERMELEYEQELPAIEQAMAELDEEDKSS